MPTNLLMNSIKHVKKLYLQLPQKSSEMGYFREQDKERASLHSERLPFRRKGIPFSSRRQVFGSVIFEKLAVLRRVKSPSRICRERFFRAV